MTKLDGPEKPLTLESTFELLNISGRQWLHHLFWIEICPQQVNTWINNQQVNTWNNNQQINTWNNEKQVNTWNSRRQILIYMLSKFVWTPQLLQLYSFVCMKTLDLLAKHQESNQNVHVLEASNIWITVSPSCHSFQDWSALLLPRADGNDNWGPFTYMNRLLGYIHIYICL